MARRLSFLLLFVLSSSGALLRAQNVRPTEPLRVRLDALREAPRHKLDDARRRALAAHADAQAAVGKARTALLELDADLERRGLDFARPRVADRIEQLDAVSATLDRYASGLQATGGERLRRAAADYADGLEELSPQPFLPPAGPVRDEHVSTDATSARRRSIRSPSNDPTRLGPPVPADYAATSEAPWTPEIRALADQLGRDPVRIYRHVRDTIRYDPYYGSRKGALLTLWEESGSAYDIANLLVALLRSSGHAARYLQGRTRITEAQAVAWLGVTNAQTAERFFANGRTPVTRNTDGSLFIEHVWVAAYVPATGRWVLLDAAFKEIRIHAPVSLPEETRIDAEAFLRDLRATGVVDTSSRAVWTLPRVPSAHAPQSPDEDVDLITTTLMKSVNATAAWLAKNPTHERDLFGWTEIVAGPAAYPPPSPLQPLDLIVTSSVPRDMNAALTVEVWDAEGKQRAFTYTATLPELAAKRVTILYVPATTSDQRLVDQYGGTLITTPPIVNLLPVLYVDGREVARGSARVMMGTLQRWQMGFRYPPSRGYTVGNQVRAGDTLAIGLAYGRASVEAYDASVARLTAQRAALPRNAQGFPNFSAPENFREPLTGEALHAAVQLYWAQSDTYRDIVGSRYGVRWLRLPGGGVSMMPIAFATIFGAVYGTDGAAFGFDIQANTGSAVSRDGDAADESLYNRMHGVYSSALEHSVWENLGVRALSTIRLLNTALERGVAIYHLDSTNKAMLSRLNLNGTAENHIKTALDNGQQVIAHAEELKIGEWQGAGYITRDPVSGASGYWITGGFAAGDVTIHNGGWIVRALKLPAAVAWALYSLYADVRVVMLGGAMFSLGPVPAAGGVVLGYAGTKAASEDLHTAVELMTGKQDVDAYILEEVQNFAVDRIVLGRAGRLLKKELEAVMPVADEYLDAFVDVAKQWSRDFGKMVDELAKRGSGTQMIAANAAVTRRELVILGMVDKTPATWEQLEALRASYGWPLVDELVRNDFLFAEDAIAPVASAIRNAPPAEGSDAALMAAAKATSFHAPYVLVAAKRVGVASRYGAPATVTYRPVTGFNAFRQPIDGAAVTENVTFDFEHDGQLYAVQHAAMVTEDVRVWNLVRKAQAAYDAKLTAKNVTLAMPGSVTGGLLSWAFSNAKNVNLATNRRDALR